MCKIEDKDESIISHIEELRNMILKCLRVFGIVLIPIFFVAPKCLKIFINLILRENAITLNYFSPMEVFIIQIKFALIISLILAFPYIVRQIWLFCVPALYEHERKFIKSIVLSSSILFVLGSLFCLFIILPLIINFGMSFSTGNIKAVFGISNVIELALWLILAFGIMFQLPLVVKALIKFDIVSIKTIKNARPYVVVFLLVAAGILTPPDIISQILLFLPTYLLFELGLLFSKDGKNE